MHETNLPYGIYLQNGDLLVYPDQYGLNLANQWDERSIDASYVKSLTLNPIGFTETDSSCGLRVSLTQTGINSVQFSIKGIHHDAYRLSLNDATSLLEYINKVSPEIWV